MYYIGVDLGTSSVKLLLLGDEGICNIVSREYTVSYPKYGWSEQNPEDWWRETVEGIKLLTADIDRTLVKGISFGGQMHGLVILDSNDNVIRPAILWNDTRTQQETDYLNNSIGKKGLVDLTGNIAFAGFTAPKIIWLRNNEPDNFRKISKIMLPKDYIIYRLTGKHCTDVSDASGTLLLDVKNRCWSEKMLEITGVSKEQLPELYESYEVVGKIKNDIANILGFNEVKVIAGAGDNAAGAIGTGTINNGDCNISLGTSGTIFVASDRYAADYENAIHNFCHSTGKYHYMACMLSAASCNKWWLENIIETTDYAAEYVNYNKLGENKVFFLPYLMGERSPLNDSDIRGMFYGMSMSTTRQDMSVAILEGVAFALRQNIDIIKSMGVDINKSKICGGGTKNKLWLKIIANVLNIKLEVPENQEGASYGAALLAAKGCSEEDYSKAADKLKISYVVNPEKEIVERYNNKYAYFMKLYPSIKSALY
ncbi:MAG: xylulokinase [Clostridia bacterium]|nr:xylulokinase [Clostridia bacterium]